MSLAIQVTIRRVGNSHGVLLPKSLLERWKLGVGDFMIASDEGLVPAPKQNLHLLLDDLKLVISMEVVSRFSAAEIRKKSRANLARWKKQGTWGAVFEEWRDVLKCDDQTLIRTMIGRDDRSNRLRQSMPYAGLLPKEVIGALREKI